MEQLLNSEGISFPVIKLMTLKRPVYLPAASGLLGMMR
jgi:hypothetical protein